MNCKYCIKCNEPYPIDDMKTDAFGDSSIRMCRDCLINLQDNNDEYLLVEVPDIYGTTFIFKLELENLKRYVGTENVVILNM